MTFRYPRGWREVASASGGNRTGDGVTFLGASGAVQVGVNYDNHYAFDGSVAPRPFTGASEADEHRLLSVISPPKLFLTKLTRVGGLRVVEVEYSQELPQGAPIAGDVREIEVASAWVGDSRRPGPLGRVLPDRTLGRKQGNLSGHTRDRQLLKAGGIRLIWRRLMAARRARASAAGRRRTADKTHTHGSIWLNMLTHRGRRETETVQHNRVQLITAGHGHLTSAKP